VVLPTGRAGLLPESMTVESDDDESAVSHEARVESAGAPPWAAVTPDALASMPPPWETGPWPGPEALGARGAGQATAASLARPDGTDPRGASPPPGGGSRWTARTVLTAGLIPLVVPGVVLGVLSLRSSAGPAVRRAAWLAIGASIAWAVIIVVVVASTGGGAGVCGGYPAGVRQAYQQVLSDFSKHAPRSVQAADLEIAASRANASAAAAGQVGVRTALFTMAGDMAQARADILARRPVPVALRQHIGQDGTIPAGSCAG
jgi:hypothetical protein